VKPERRRMYTGRSGQLAVKAELLMRGCNTSSPEVDIGEDVLTWRDGQPDIVHVQVKTGNAEALKERGHYAARVSVPLGQLGEPETVPLFYTFAIRHGERWVDFVIISRRELNTLRRGGLGYENARAGELQLYLSFGPESLTCSGRDLSPHRNAWGQLPLSWPDAGSPEGPG
jgi:hypothetical protein